MTKKRKQYSAQFKFWVALEAAKEHVFDTYFEAKIRHISVLNRDKNCSKRYQWWWS